MDATLPTSVDMQNRIEEGETHRRTTAKQHITNELAKDTSESSEGSDTSETGTTAQDLSTQQHAQKDWCTVKERERSHPDRIQRLEQPVMCSHISRKTGPQLTVVNRRGNGAPEFENGFLKGHFLSPQRSQVAALKSPTV